MKVSLFFFCLFTFFAGNPNETRTLDNDLIAYYSFDDCTARDLTGNGAHGQLFGSVDCWCGVNQQGLLFDGVNDYLEFSGDVNKYFGSSDFTLSFYVRTFSTTIFPQSLVSKRADCSEEFLLDLRYNKGTGQIDTDLKQNDINYHKEISPDIGETQWIHYAIVREGPWASTYINGVLQKSSKRCRAVDISNDAVLSFSNSPCIRSGKSRRFKGVLDEVKVFGRALMEAEVNALYLLHPVEDAELDCVS